MKKVWMGLILLIAFVFVFSGCGTEKRSEEILAEEDLYGLWEITEGTAEFSEAEFFDDGTYTTNRPNLKGAFSLTGNRIKFEGYLVQDVVETVKVDGDKMYFLTDSDKEKCVFSRK